MLLPAEGARTHARTHACTHTRKKERDGQKQNAACYGTYPGLVYK
jgi:hypothetical protein